MTTYFISDLHMEKIESPIANTFSEFLKRLNQNDTLYILGDLFESWIGDDNVSELSQFVIDQLNSLSNQGIHIGIMHGNRDFLIGEAFANEVGISILSDPYALNINGLNVILSHGDFLCTDDIDYMDFRNMVRSEVWQKDFLSKNLDERNEIANSLRSTSKDATSKKSLEITDANPETINDFMQKNQPDIFIHGHTHRPKIHEDNLFKRVVLGDWDKSGWYLSITENNLDLKEFKI